MLLVIIIFVCKDKNKNLIFQTYRHLFSAEDVKNTQAMRNSSPPLSVSSIFCCTFVPSTTEKSDEKSLEMGDTGGIDTHFADTDTCRTALLSTHSELGGPEGDVYCFGKDQHGYQRGQSPSGMAVESGY